jgi:Leucine-rich repeat (LRR) protein
LECSLLFSPSLLTHRLAQFTTGPIPDAWGLATNIKDLLLDRNRLTGSIPATLGGMASLRWLTLDHNLLTGSIPPALEGLPSLQGLDLAENDITLLRKPTPDEPLRYTLTYLDACGNNGVPSVAAFPTLSLLPNRTRCGALR